MRGAALPSDLPIVEASMSNKFFLHLERRRFYTKFDIPIRINGPLHSELKSYSKAVVALNSKNPHNSRRGSLIRRNPEAEFDVATVWFPTIYITYPE